MLDPRNKRQKDESKDRNESTKDVKRRGRPRLEKHDENAVDRRRTQIRMAQRAYRERKESTLDELRKRVTDLLNTLELINSAFVECRESLLSVGASSAQSRQLGKTADRILSLMQNVRNPEEQDDSSSDGCVTSTTNPLQENHGNLTLSARNVAGWMDAAALQSEPGMATQTGGSLGYTVLDLTDPALWDPYRVDSMAQTTTRQSLYPSAVNALLQDRAQESLFVTPTLVAPPQNQLELPKTYSFHESSFGRRLHRAGLEAAYYLLLNKSRQPKDYDRVFRLSLLGRDERALAKAFKDILSRGPHEGLTLGTPLIHVGGAGTHYRRKSGDGTWHPKQETYNIGTVGLQTLAFLETASEANPGPAVTVEVAGFEGVWFDPYDVEGYLEEQGIRIDPQSSFADVQPRNWSNSSSDTPYSRSVVTPLSPQLDQDRTADFTANTPGSGQAFMAGLYSSALDKPGYPGVGFSDSETGSWLNFAGYAKEPTTLRHEPSRIAINSQGLDGQSSSSEKLAFRETRDQFQSIVHPLQSNYSSSPAERKHAVMDVNRFLKLLIGTGICLGRVPGFRKSDVDRALANSKFEV